MTGEEAVSVPAEDYLNLGPNRLVITPEQVTGRHRPQMDPISPVPPAEGRRLQRGVCDARKLLNTVVGRKLRTGILDRIACGRGNPREHENFTVTFNIAQFAPLQAYLSGLIARVITGTPTACEIRMALRLLF
jgi:hypothetical protein